MALVRAEISMDISVDDFDEDKFVKDVESVIRSLNTEERMINKLDVVIAKVRKNGLKYTRCADTANCKHCPEVISCDRGQEAVK